MSRLLRSSAAILLAGIAFAAGAAGERDAINVGALRNPVDKSYRRMMEGMALFERERALAPGAALRYKLLPRKRETRMEGIELAIVGDSFETPVEVTPELTFTLPRDRKALAENASVRPNRRAQTMTWRADVRTPGLPASVRRLGDLRLECRVGMQAGLVSDYRSSGLLEFLAGGPEFCAQREAPYLFFAEQPVFGVTLRHGERAEALSVARLYGGVGRGGTRKEELAECDCAVLMERAYTVPLGDRSWPDDTLVELVPMQSSAGELSGYRREEVQGLFGPAIVTRFDSGQEVWSYRYGNRRFDETELVVLFDASGAVMASRLRPGK